MVRAMETVRILPLGDSITYGDGGTHAGYRSTLAELLTGAGMEFRFVGTSRENPGSLRGDRVWHEGHPGWVIRAGRSGREGLTEHVPRMVRAQLAPDVILLMIGTNDVAMDLELESAAQRLDELVGLLIDPTGLAPRARLFVAQITPILDADGDARARTFNAALTELVARRASPRVQLVDMHTPLGAPDMADGLHPNDAGYRKIARAWFEALTLGAHFDPSQRVAYSAGR
jgi:lysophospholipase L1-like esterase